MFKLATKRLTLRDIRLEDETAFVALSQDEKYQRFYSEVDCTPEKYRELTRLFIEQATTTPRTAYQLAIDFQDIFIGTACLRVEPERQASIGCGLARPYQGQGFIQEAMDELIQFGFNELGVHRIYAETISENRSAIKLCQQLGMKQEAHLKHNRYFKNRWWDTVIMAKLE